jgi:RNA polymerase sigma factor (sigma-70 family)
MPLDAFRQLPNETIRSLERATLPDLTRRWGHFAEDALQNALIVLTSDPSSYEDRSFPELVGFIRTTAHRRALKEWQHEERQNKPGRPLSDWPLEPHQAASTGSGRFVEDQVGFDRFRAKTPKEISLPPEAAQAIAQLSMRQQQVLTLAVVYDMSESEIAKTLCISVGTVKRFKSRARKILRTRGPYSDLYRT